MEYAIYDNRRKEYWSGSYTNRLGYQEPILTNIPDIGNVKTRRKPKIYKSKNAAEKGKEKLLGNISNGIPIEISKNLNYDFEVVPYNK